MDHQEYLNQRATANEKTREELFGKAKSLENEDRECFSRYRDGWEVVGREDLGRHPHRSLIPVYDKTGAAMQQAYSIDAPTSDDGDRDKRVFFLNKKDRQALTGQLAVVPTLADFRSTFMDIFCEGQLRYMNWDNVFAAGGGVLACAQPIPAEHTVDYGARRRYFHELQYSSSDVDLFLYGLDEAGAKKKLEEIYKAVCESNPTTVVCFRSAHAVTLVSQFPFRHIQIVLRLYSSPYEVLAGFDVDACTVGYDGKMVYCDVRAHHALVSRRNTIDVTRRSPSYEMRLAKYGVRGFEVEVKDLKRDMVDPGIFERPWNSLDGLAKLLVLERLRTPEQRSRFFEMQKLNRGGGNMGYHRGPRYDSLTQERIEEKLGGTAEEFSAESTMRLMAKKDQKLNSAWFSRDRPYRLHPCFFGTAEEILDDCSKDDPPFPAKKENEDTKLKEHRETYVRGRLTFITDDPGRQRIGSFHPLSEVGWAEGVYFHSSTEELFAATNANDPARVKSALEFCVQGPDSRDFFGRTALHLSLMAGALNATKALLEAGSSPLEPMAGGRTVFHLAALYDLDEILPVLRDYAEKTIMKKYAEEEAQASGQQGGAADQMDVVGGGADSKESKLAKKAKQTIKQTIRARDGDGKLTALQLSLVLGNLKVARALLKAGAALTVEDEVVAADGTTAPYQLVTLLPAQYLEEGIKLLVEFGFSSAVRLPTRFFGGTPFLDVVQQNDVLAAKLLLKHDPTAIKALSMINDQMIFPLKFAVEQRSVEMTELLLSTKKSPVNITEEMMQEARKYVDQTNWQFRNFQGDVPVIFIAVKNALSSIRTLRFKILPSYVNPFGRGKVIDDASVRSSLKSTIKQARMRVFEPENSEDSIKICLLLAEHADLKLRSKLVVSNYNFQSIGDYSVGQLTFEDTFWSVNRKLAQGTRPDVNPSEYAAFFIGKLLQEAEKAKAPTADEPQANAIIAASLELESHLAKTHPLMSTILKGWRSHLEINGTDGTEKDAFDGLDEAILKDIEKTMKEIADNCDKWLRDLEKALDCPKEIVDFVRTTTLPGAVGQTRRLFYGRANVGGVQQSVQEGASPFPATSDLFFIHSDPERDVRNFLIAMEQRNPVPLPFPSDIVKNKSSTEPWAIASLQRSLFKMCGRSFFPLENGGQNPKVRYGEIMEYPRTIINPSAVKYSKFMQEQCSLVFAQCYSGQVGNLEQSAKEVPMATSNMEGYTPLTCAIMSANPEMLREVIRLCSKQFAKPQKDKKAKAPGRIDNFELMAEDEEDEDGGSDDDEDDEPAEKDDEEEDDDDDDDSDAKAKKKKEKEEAAAAPGSSSVKPEQLFGLIANVFLEDLPLVKDVGKLVEQLELRHGHGFVTGKITQHMPLTPLQLAIVLNDIPVTETLVEEAKKLSPVLLCQMMTHQVADSMQTSWDLLIILDRAEILQILLTKAGMGLPFAPLATRLGVPTWKYKIESAQGGPVQEVAAQTRTRKVKGAGRYIGLQSSLFGETRKKNEMKRDPRLARIEILPTPNETFLHTAAQYGASKCYKYLMDGPAIKSACVSFLSRDPTHVESIRDLFKKVRERTPKSFSSGKFASKGENDIEADAEIIFYFILGGAEDSVPDIANRTPLHYAIAGESLVKLLQDGIQFSSKVLKRSYSEVAPLDAIRFTTQRDPALGDFVTGGSPLSLACWLNDEAAVEKLLELGFNPNESDKYTYGMNAFHLALHAKAWKCAILVAKKMSPSKLLEPNQFGITPLMTAARSGTVDGLLAAITACPDAKIGMVPQSVSLKNIEGNTALHFAANARFAETLRTIMDWVVENGPNSSEWLAEDFTTGRTPLDSAINSVIAQELQASSARFAQEKQKKSREAIAEYLTEEEKEGNKHVDFSLNGREVALLLHKQALGKNRVRALFGQVRPAREKRLDLVGSSVDADNSDVRKLQEDFIAVYPNTQVVMREQFLIRVENQPVKTYLFALPTLWNLGSVLW